MKKKSFKALKFLHFFPQILFLHLPTCIVWNKLKRMKTKIPKISGMQGTIKIILPVLFYYSHLIMFTYGSKLPFSAHLQKLLTAGVLHYMIDVKTLSFELLVYFTPSVAFIQCIFQKAFSLSQSSKFGECESAALLFALCLRLVVLILQAIIHF